MFICIFIYACIMYGPKMVSILIRFFSVVEKKQENSLDGDSSDEKNANGRESVSIAEMEACLETGNAFNRSASQLNRHAIPMKRPSGERERRECADRPRDGDCVAA